MSILDVVLSYSFPICHFSTPFNTSFKIIYNSNQKYSDTKKFQRKPTQLTSCTPTWLLPPHTPSATYRSPVRKDYVQ